MCPVPWIDQLRPALGEKQFFFTEALKRLQQLGSAPAWGQPPEKKKRAAAFGHVEWE